MIVALPKLPRIPVTTEHLAAALKYARKRADLTQNEMAWKAGVTLARWVDLETGVHQPTIGELQAVADALDSEIVFKPTRCIQKVVLK